jgi:UDP-glucose 4-epimerase
VYGIRQRYDAYGNVIPIFVTRILTGEELLIYGDGEQTRDFINVEDVARANLAAALANGVSGAFNVGSATRISINELVTRLESAAGTRVRVRHVESRPGDVRHSLADISAIRQKIGFNPIVSLAEGLPRYVEWMRTDLKPSGRAV